MWHMKSIRAEDVPAIWPIVLPQLAPAIAVTNGRTSMGEIFRQLAAERCILWVVFEDDQPVAASFITRVAQYPLKRMLVVEACGGSEMAEWLPTVIDVLRRFAADSGLAGVEMFGRPGWARALRPYGWATTLVLCEIDAPGARQENG